MYPYTPVLLERGCATRFQPLSDIIRTKELPGAIDMAHTIAWEGQTFATVSYTRHTSDNEVLEVVQELQANENYDRLNGVLHDYSHCESCAYSEDKLLEISAWGAAGANTNSRLKIAVVSNRKDVTDMCGCFLKQDLNPYPLKVFPTIADAKEWLDK